MQPLWIAAVTGLTTSAFITELEQAGIYVDNIDIGSEKLVDVLHQVPRLSCAFDGDDASPFDLSGIQLAQYYSKKGTTEDVVLIVGDTLDDFCLYYCLSRMRPDVASLPLSWLERFEQGKARAEQQDGALFDENHYAPRLISSIMQLPEHLRGMGQIVLASGSTDRATLDALILRLDACSYMPSGQLQSRLRVAESAESLISAPHRAYEKEHRGRPSVAQFVGTELPGFLETPKPRRFDKIVQGHTWISEIAVRYHQVPRHFALGSLVVRDNRLSTNGARAGSEGLAYFCLNVWSIGGRDVDAYLVRPQFFLPDALATFQHLASLCEMACSVSSQGFYTEDAARRFGGLEQLSLALRDPITLAVLQKFRDSKAPAGGIWDDGVLLRPELRRYLASTVAYQTDR